MVDSENARAALSPRRNTKPGDLRLEESRRHARHHHESAESMIVRHASPKGKARDLRVVPLYRERDRSIAQDAEIEAVMGVLPDVISVDDEVLAERLLKSSVKFIAPSGMQRDVQAWRAS